MPAAAQSGVYIAVQDGEIRIYPDRNTAVMENPDADSIRFRGWGECV